MVCKGQRWIIRCVTRGSAVISIRQYVLSGSMAVAAILFLAPAALAQGAPMQLGPSGARPASPPVSSAPAAPVPETPQILLQKVNQSLNGISTMVADFSQINADGRRRSGKLYVQRPGKLRFDYNPPTQLEVVADGSNVAVLDKKVPQQDIYGIKQTPLKFLVSEKIDIAKDTTLLSVKRERDEIILDIEDKNTVAGTSKLKIHFHGDSLVLKRWTVTDPQGIPTTVMLANINTQQRLERGLFMINYQFNAARGSSN
jgi:outer membrane lipoprotein-sorting protein